jgi:hypothetical protein
VRCPRPAKTALRNGAARRTGPVVSPRPLDPPLKSAFWPFADESIARRNVSL